MSTKNIGILGENLAVKFLENKGYKILDRNFKFEIGGPQKGEIDIIAKKGDLFSFVEVKTLRRVSGQSFLFSPEAKVDFIKMRKIIKTAQLWLMKNKIGFDNSWQVDVVAVIINENPLVGGQKTEIRHLENATC
jgi:putative endonuclease